MAARDKLVASTVGLMQRRGVAAAGVADILEASGVSRRSIYLNFPGGKPQLVCEATRVAAEWITARIGHLGDSAGSQEALSAFVAQWKAVLIDNDYEASCPIVAAAMARSVAPEATDVAAAAFDTWVEALSTALAGRSGIDAERARSIATTVVAAVEGAVVMGVAQQSVRALEQVERELAVMIAHAARNP